MIFCEAGRKNKTIAETKGPLTIESPYPKKGKIMTLKSSRISIPK